MTTRFSDAFVQPGEVLDLVAPYDRAPGEGALVGTIFGVAQTTVLSGKTGGFYVEKVFNLTKLSTETCSAGDRLYWDDTNKRVTNDGSKGPMIGSAVIAAANPSTTYRVKLKEGPAVLAQATSTSTVAATGSTQADAAALPAAGFVLVSAADGTKGVILPANAAGKRVEIKNNTAAILKVYPVTSGAINALSANAAISMASLSSATFVSYDGTTWYTCPTVPS